MTKSEETIRALLGKSLGGQWTASFGHCEDSPSPFVWHEDGDAVCQVFSNLGAWPDAVVDDNLCAYIAACNPVAIAELLSRLDAAQADAEQWRRLGLNNSSTTNGSPCGDNA